MFGPKFTMDMLVGTIARVRPSTVALGTHHYVQMAESNILDNRDPSDFDSVKALFPAGAAVPSSCETKLKKKFTGLLVTFWLCSFVDS